MRNMGILQLFACRKAVINKVWRSINGWYKIISCGPGDFSPVGGGLWKMSQRLVTELWMLEVTVAHVVVQWKGQESRGAVPAT